MRWVIRHFRRYRERAPWDFCWRIAVEGTVVSLAVSFVLAFLGMADRRIDLSLNVLLAAGVIVAPVLETLILQALPIGIARLLKAGFSAQIITSIVFFTLGHAIEGVQAGVAVGVCAGFYFAFTYAHWRDRGRWSAFWITTVSHAIHNAIVICLALAAGEIPDTPSVL